MIDVSAHTRNSTGSVWAHPVKTIATALLVLGLLAALTTTYVRLVLGHEVELYHWDNATYFHHIQAVSFALREGLAELLRTMWSFRNQTYNAYFTLPILPLFESLGGDCFAFISAMSVTFLVPALALAGGIASLSVREKRMVAFWAAVIVGLISKPLWYYLLRGFPDIGAVALLWGAVLTYLYTGGRPWWATIGTGLLLGSAILFRRHFAYAVASFYVTAALVEVGTALTQRSKPLSSQFLAALSSLAPLACSAAVAAGVLALLATGFLKQAITVNYAELYADYKQTIPVFFARLGYLHGLLFPSLAVAGYAMAWRRKVIRPRAVLFMVLWTVVWLVLWLGSVRQGGPHQMLHVLPLVVILGIAAGAAALWTTSKWRVVIGGGVVMLTLAQTLFVFGAFLVKGSEDQSYRSYVFPDTITPMRHHVRDYAAYLELAGSLRERLDPAHSLYVAASSQVHNGGVLLEAERQLAGGSPHKLVMTPAADIDSRDFLPITTLAWTSHVLLFTPVQYHLMQYHHAVRPDPPQQEVVRVAVEAFTDGWSLADDFAPVMPDYAFSGGVRAVLLERRQQTSAATMVRTLHRMRHAVTPFPGSQPSWILNAPPPAGTAVQSDGTSALRSAQGGRTDFVRVAPLAGPTTVAATLVPNDPDRCRSATTTISALLTTGSVSVPGPTITVADETSLREHLAPGNQGYLAVTVLAPPDCTVTIRDLQVVPAQ